MIRKLQIGDVQLENNLILAPMAGVTDLPFRLLCKEQGAGLLCMEMVSAKAILYNNKNTEALMAIDDREPPVSLQLFGSDPDVISEMAKRIEERPFSILDINMGCPVPKVTGNGEGSALMKNPKLVEEIITKTARAIRKPVTVKIRKGFDESHVNAVEIAKIAEASGAAAVAVHGRTREQYYSGKADWDIIRQVKEAVKIPVIGNGDIFEPQDAKRMLEETGCDGVMVGRAAQGNPWIFREILEYLETQKDVSAALMNLGGSSVMTYGSKPDGSSWNVAVTDPRAENDDDYLGVVALNGTEFLSTSGDYEKYFIEDGVRYHHIMDPSTGYPAKSGVTGVTVVCDTGLEADALSTACFVLGVEKGAELLKTYGADGLFVDEDHHVYLTEGMKERFSLLADSYSVEDIIE